MTKPGNPSRQAAMGVPAPSGEQFELRFGEQRAVVTQVGGGLRVRLPAIVRSSTATTSTTCALPAVARCSSRGRTAFWEDATRSGGASCNSRSTSTSRTPRFTASSDGRRGPQPSGRSTVSSLPTLPPRPGYPFALALRIEYTLSSNGLSVATTATNVGVDPCPYGAVSYPYLRAGGGSIDSSILHLPARTRARGGGTRPTDRHEVR